MTIGASCIIWKSAYVDALLILFQYSHFLYNVCTFYIYICVLSRISFVLSKKKIISLCQYVVVAEVMEP